MSGHSRYSSRGIRTSDRERERVVTKLQHEFAAGRLTTAELEQRIAAAQAARTREQLRALTADLPAELAPSRATPARPDPRWLCLLWCVCPPAGLVYSLLSRLAIRGET
jgi:outer membrane protein TolC